MKRILSLVLSIGLLLTLTIQGVSAQETPWRLEEEGGRYVTVRVPCPQGEDLVWAQARQLTVRYEDTGQVVPLSSDYIQGYLFATVPAEEAHRPLEAFPAENVKFSEGYTRGVDGLAARGMIRGEPQGTLRPDDALTWGEALAMFSRMLSLEPVEEPACAHGGAHGWYCPYAACALEAGIVEPDELNDLQAPMERAWFVLLLDRVMEQVGWLQEPPDTFETLEAVDKEEIPHWALDSYLRLAPYGVYQFLVERETEEIGLYGYPVSELLALPNEPIIRREAISILNDFRSRPWYPKQAAIDLGVDQEMPVIDGSTSSYPYTQALYNTLFYGQHPDMPKVHSTTHQSYERLIRGEADMLFAATLPSQELLAQAQEAGVALECIPIAYDAMVFFTNEENSIESLTRQQIQDIYVSGTYENWNQVGGPDAELLPYRRNMDSGSYALLERYFLEDGALSLSPDVENVLTSYSMTSALSDVAEALREDPPAYALGFSLYYYYQNNEEFLEAVTPNRLKLLAVDGIMPTDQTIHDGSYPLADYNYVVLRTDTEQDDSVRRLAEFMLTTEGQKCVSTAGFGPL